MSVINLVIKLWKERITSRDKTFIRLKGIGLPSEGSVNIYSQRLFLSVSHYFATTVCSTVACQGN